MSKLAELLVSRGVLPTSANPANPANPQPHISNISNFSRGSPAGLSFPPDLERRIRAMAARWKYSSAELADAMERAHRKPADWACAIALDEQREAEFREYGLLPSTDA